MGKAYEVHGCKDCPHMQTTHPFYMPTYCQYLIDSPVALSFESVFQIGGIPKECLLPDMPISKMETTTSAKGGV
jgi:hypothetical protein